METARHQRIKELFDAACSEPGSERFAFVARECGDDEAMRRELESLLAFYDDGEPVQPRRTRQRAERGNAARTIAGRYRIERRLGAGGMGEVYAAYDGLMREPVALKLFPHADTDQRRRLVEEVRLARLVTHPAVCRVYDLGEDAGNVFLTMELIDGEDLAGRLSRSGPLPSGEVASIGRTLSEALAAAHEAGVLHRDLKPSNILIGRDGKVRIADFGIATRSAPGSAESAVRRFGTLGYMAPEETIGGVATQQSDLYSLGLVLYELLTGAPALATTQADSLVDLRRAPRFDRPSTLVPDVDADLEALVLQLLEQDPAQRPESARAVAAVLGTLTLAVPGEPVAEAERRQIVALSCELEARPDLVNGGRWAEIVRTFQARCFAACRRRGGQVARHSARGLLVYFGLPRRAEQDAEHAVQAGLEILADLSSRPLVASGVLAPAVSISVDAPVVAVRAGRHVSSRGRALGDTGPVATPASSDRVVVSGALQPLLRGSFVTTPLDVPPAGRAYVVSRGHDPLGFSGDGVRLTPFVGRALELARLEQAWRDARSGSGQVVLLSGEAGIGKTRLVREIWQRVREDGGRLHEARCSSLHSHTPLHPFVEMVGQTAGLAPDDDADTRHAKLRRALAPFGPRADSLLGVFSAWLPVGSSTALVPSTRHDRRAAIAAIEECVVTLSEQHPLLLVCEDLHWSDPTTREAIDRLVDGVRTARILLVLTFRPDFEPRWGGTGVNHLALQPLRVDEARSMVSLFPQAEHRPELGARAGELVERADGNPLFLEELMRHTVETSRGASDRKAVPGTLKGLLSARLDRLGSARRLAQAASVCGRSVSYLVLAGLVSETESVQFETELSRLIDGEILLQHGPSNRAIFTFRHALLREAAYEALSPRERRRLHALAARALPELDRQSESQPELVAIHWTAAKHHDLAYSWWRKAGFLALERTAYSEAEYHLEQALRALPFAVAEPERDAQRLEIELALTALEAGRHGPGSNEAARRARRAEALAANLPDGDQVARAIMTTARLRYARGEMRAALRKLEPLWARVDRIEDPYLRAAVLTQAGNLLSTLGRLDEAERFQERAIAVYARAEQRPAGAFTTDPLAHLMVTRAVDDWLRGRTTQSRRWLDAAIAHADRLAHPFSRALVRMLGASLALRQGDRALSSLLLEEGSALAAAVGSNWLTNMADVYAPLLDPSLSPDDAALRIAAAIDRTSGSWVMRSLQWSELARVLESAGQSEDATRAMERALREARRRDRAMVPEILRRRGELMARQGDRAGAHASLGSGLKLARRERTFGLELLCVLTLARLLLEENRTDEARQALATTLAGLPDDVTAPERAQAGALLAGLDSKPPRS